MAKRSIATRKTLIDPLFALPPGGEEEFVFSRDTADGDIGNITDDDFYDGDDVDDDDYDDGETPDNDFALDTPEIVGILPPQILRRAPGGQQVVDIVLEVEEVLDATTYEIQVDKV